MRCSEGRSAQSKPRIPPTPPPSPAPPSAAHLPSAKRRSQAVQQRRACQQCRRARRRYYIHHHAKLGCRLRWRHTQPPRAMGLRFGCQQGPGRRVGCQLRLQLSAEGGSGGREARVAQEDGRECLQALPCPALGSLVGVQARPAAGHAATAVGAEDCGTTAQVAGSTRKCSSPPLHAADLRCRSFSGSGVPCVLTHWRRTGSIPTWKAKGGRGRAAGRSGGGAALEK